MKVKRIRLDKERINRAITSVLLSRVFLVPVYILMMLLVIPWILAFSGYYYLRSRYWYGCRGFKHIHYTKDPILVLTLVTLGTEPGQRLQSFSITQRKDIKTGLKGSRPWEKKSLPKLRAFIKSQERAGTKITINDDTLCAYFYGPEIYTQYPKVRLAFEALKGDPDFAGNPLGLGTGRSDPNPYATEDSALLAAIEAALAHPAS